MTNTIPTARQLRALAADAKIYGDLKLDAACQCLTLGAEGLAKARKITAEQADELMEEALVVVLQAAVVGNF